MSKHIKVRYVESGAFQGDEQDASKSGIKPGMRCVVMSTAHHRDLLKRLRGFEAWHKRAIKLWGGV